MRIALQEFEEELLTFTRALHDEVLTELLSGTSPPRRPSGSSALDVLNGDVSYPIDVRAESTIDRFFRTRWAAATTATVVAEGIGRRTYPVGAEEASDGYLFLIDPIDGSREWMYDKRSAWILTGIARSSIEEPNLSAVFLAVQTEIPTSNQRAHSVLWARRGRGVRHELRDLADWRWSQPANAVPDDAVTLDDGYGVFVDFFYPGPRLQVARLAEVVLSTIYSDEHDPQRARVFNDQYVSTGGQIFLLATGRYRFVADLRHTLSRLTHAPTYQSVHAYDLATSLIAEEAGAILRDPRGERLRYPFDVQSPCDWVGYANATIKSLVEPALLASLKSLSQEAQSQR